MPSLHKATSSDEDVLDLTAIFYPSDSSSLLRDAGGDHHPDKNLVPTPYLPPYLNPSRYPSVLHNSSSNSTFELLFQFSPTFTNIMILICLASCTVWVIVMNLLIIGALRKAHGKEKEHVTDTYLINLLFADVLLGIFVFPFMSIVILIGYFPLSQTWCNLWVYFDYYLIIASSYGFAALMCSYLMMLRWPDYYPKSTKLHIVFIIFIWIFSNVPWTVPFINDRVSVIYPDGICGFSIQKNRYFTIYIGFTGLYIPLGIALIAGIFAVKYLKQSSRAPFFKLLLQNESCHVYPLFVPSSTASEAEFNDLYQVRRNKGRRMEGQIRTQFGYVHPRNFSPPDIPSTESTDVSESPTTKEQQQRYYQQQRHHHHHRHSIMSVRTFHRNKALHDSVRKHFPLVATSLILFVLSRSLFYTYFGVGSVVPKLFPPDLSHSVYWVMHSYAVLAPVVHLLLDSDLRRAVIRFINEGTFEFSDADRTSADPDLEKHHHHRNHMDHALPKVSVIDMRRQSNHPPQRSKLECNGNVRIHDLENYPRNAHYNHYIR